MGKRKKSKQGKGEKCTYCRRTMEGKSNPGQLAATKDHWIPKSRGGEIKVWSCRKCNTMKGNMSPIEWHAFMIANPRWWASDAILVPREELSKVTALEVASRIIATLP